MSEIGAASWKRRGQILRERPQPEEPKRSNHKDTKKWCKGVKGRKHDYIWTPDLRHVYNGISDWYKHECTNCGKQDDYCFPWGWKVNIIEHCKCGFHVKVDNDSK